MTTSKETITVTGFMDEFGNKCTFSECTIVIATVENNDRKVSSTLPFSLSEFPGGGLVSDLEIGDQFERTIEMKKVE